MKDIQSIVEGSNESKSGFATAAIEKEIDRIKKERYELDIQKLVDEYKDNIVPYSKKGIKNMNDYVNTIITNTKDIKRLEKKLDEYVRVEQIEKETERIIKQTKKENPKLVEEMTKYYIKTMTARLKATTKRSRKQI